MPYDLNFWQEPDWRQESALNPNFLIAAGFCVLALVASGLLLYNILEVQSRRADISNLQLAIDQKRPAATEIERQQACINLWKRALTALEQQSQRRIVWCRQFAALQSLVPASITLERISLDSAAMKADPAEARGPGTASPGRAESVLTQYTMTLAGIAHGENSEKMITTFSRALPTQAEMAPYLAGVELTSVMPETKTGDRQGPPGRQFVVICRYKPLPMDYGDN